jgi:F-type H+-transporting ATPase subunit beta
LGDLHYETRKETLKVLERYKSLQNIIAILGEGELSEQEKLTVSRAKKILKFMSQPFFTAEQFTNNPGKYVTVEKTVLGIKAILSGEYDEVSDEPFLMIGEITEAEAKAKMNK